MKKLLYLLSAVLVVFTSCNKDDNSSPSTTSSILPKTNKYTDPAYPDDNSTSTVTYNRNKIVTIKKENSRTDYAYDGNAIVKVVTYDIVDGKDVKNAEEIFAYANNKLATYSLTEGFSTAYPTGQYKGRYVYTHNTDGTVTTEEYNTNTTTGVEKKIRTSIRTFANGNLVKEVQTSEGSSTVYTHVYEYDTKNNPFKNILGFNLLLEYEDTSTNNVIKHTSSVSGSATPSTPLVYKKEYVYDANGYPTKATSYKADGTTVSEINEYTY